MPSHVTAALALAVLLVLPEGNLLSPPTLLAQQAPQTPQLATDQPIGSLEVVATFPGPMPEGVTVSHSGRVFVNFARWGDDIPFTVAEIINGKAVAYPDANVNNWPGRTLPNPNAFGHTPGEESADQTHLVSVQSVVVDPSGGSDGKSGRLWALDTGAPLLKNTVPGGPKLVAIDLATNTVVRVILLPPETCGTDCYLNDVRFDLRVGDTGPQDPMTVIGSHPVYNPNQAPKDPMHPTAERSPGPNGLLLGGIDSVNSHAVERGDAARKAAATDIHGTAYITDSSSEGPNAIIVVDLASGRSMRRLNQHSSTLSEDQFLMFAQAQPVYQTTPGYPPKAVNFAADGIAISADGKTLFFCPINGTKLYAVATDPLRDKSKSDAEVAATVRIVTGKMPSDGLESDAEGRVYMTDPVTDSIHRWDPATGLTTTLVHDPRLLWPDTMSLATDGYLYVTSQPAQPPTHHAPRPRRAHQALHPLPTQGRRQTRPPALNRHDGTKQAQ